MARVPRTRNDGTWTEAQLFGHLRSMLRKDSQRWKPPKGRAKRLRRPSQSENKLLRWQYPCETCGGWFREDEIEYDHAVPCGPLRSFADLATFAERLYVEQDGWRLTCSVCHAAKTARDKAEMKAAKPTKETKRGKRRNPGLLDAR